jgi:predicted nucleic acid-binding Zn ribbon protein
MREMEPARRGLEKIALELVRGAPAAEQPVIAWPLACGAAVAGKTHAAGFADGVLTVEVPNAQWRLELREMSGQYLAALRRLLGESVRRIEFVIAQPRTSRSGDPR